MENKWTSIYFLVNEKLTHEMKYLRYLIINIRFYIKKINQ